MLATVPPMAERISVRMPCTSAPMITTVMKSSTKKAKMRKELPLVSRHERAIAASGLCTSSIAITGEISENFTNR